MMSRLKMFFIFLMNCAFITMLWVITFETIDETPSMKISHFVNTEGCFIPHMDPFSASVIQFKSPALHLRCWENSPLTIQENLILRLNKILVAKIENFSHCQYESIDRGSHQDNSISFSKKTNFTSDVDISLEFIRVICFNTSGRKIYTNFHAFLPLKKNRIIELDQKLLAHKDMNKPKEILNILMIGMDSLSMLNHIRQMPKTRSFLMNELSAIDIQGYNKVADNTYVNIVPILTGNYVSEELLQSNTSSSRGPFDKFNFIWKHYANNGYSTMFAEDHPLIGTFNYLADGFADPPTDHYTRPFTLALERDLSAWKKGRDCVWNRSGSKVILDYTLDFMKQHRHRPCFGYSFITRLTHDHVSYPAYADDDYLEHFQALKAEGVFDNTVLFFFGDHGLRYGAILKTEIGKAENRMPMMYIVFPPWFKNKYPKIFQNVKDNSQKLTSNFDIHETLKDILFMTGQMRENVDVSQRGISLFDHIPETRTCDDASILPQWCMCKTEKVTLLPGDTMYNKSIEFLIDGINLQLVEHPMCKKLQLLNVTYVTHLSNKSYRLKFKPGRNIDHKTGLSVYKIYLTLMPGMAEFEATLKYNTSTNIFNLAGGISRTTIYGNTAYCMLDKTLQKICYCKNQPSTHPTPPLTTTLATTAIVPTATVTNTIQPETLPSHQTPSRVLSNLTRISNLQAGSTSFISSGQTLSTPSLPSLQILIPTDLPASKSTIFTSASVLSIDTISASVV